MPKPGVGRTVLTMLCVSLLACGGDDKSATAGGQARATEDPCALLSAELLRTEFGLEQGAEFSHEPSKYSPHPLCTASWQGPDAAEIEAKSQAAMQEYLQKKMRGEEAKIPSFRTRNEVTLTLYQGPFASEAEAQQAFTSAMAVLNKGIKGSSGSVEVEFQADTVAVDGVGDEAQWAERMRQLSVLSGRRIFHLGVRTTGESDVDLAHARQLARAVAGEL